MTALRDKNGQLLEPAKEMTLRDYFAAKAISSMFEFDAIDGKTVTFNDIAKMSYELADAMLKEREK